jgi:hypothetical protein
MTAGADGWASRPYQKPSVNIRVNLWLKASRLRELAGCVQCLFWVMGERR